jgi:hypothetical protein
MERKVSVPDDLLTGKVYNALKHYSFSVLKKRLHRGNLANLEKNKNIRQKLTLSAWQVCLPSLDQT